MAVIGDDQVGAARRQAVRPALVFGHRLPLVGADPEDAAMRDVRAERLPAK